MTEEMKKLQTTRRRMMRMIIQTKRQTGEAHAAAHATSVDDNADVEPRDLDSEQGARTRLSTTTKTPTSTSSHWLCAGNLFDHPNEAAKRAHQGLSRRAHVEAMDTPCLWFRGLLPAEYTTGLLPPPASEETAMVFGAGRASTPGYLIRNHPL